MIYKKIFKKNRAPGGLRTLTLLAQGFEACVSTSSTTRATCNQYTNCREVATRPIRIRLWVPAGAPYLTIGSPEDVRSQVLTGASCGLYCCPEGSRTPVTRSKFLRITVMLRGNKIGGLPIHHPLATRPKLHDMFR